MKKIEIITRPEKLEEIKEILEKMEIHGMTVVMVSGCGLQKGRKEIYRGAEVSINLLPKVKIEIVLKTEKVEKLVDEVCSIVRTGEVGDGKIFISPIEDVVRIRTKQRGLEALH